MKVLGSLAMKPITIPTAFILDTIYGPVDEMTITTYDAQGRHLNIDQRQVKAYRLNEEIGFSYVPGGSEIHTGTTVFNALKAGESWTINHIGHEIGHTYQAGEWAFFYWGTVAPLTFPANAMDMLGIRNTPFHFFETNASYRGRYIGIK